MLRTNHSKILACFQEESMNVFEMLCTVGPLGVRVMKIC